MEGLVGSVLPLLLMFAIFYFLLIRPQQKRQKQTRQMQESVQKGDRVVTIGGFHGMIEAVDETTIVLRAGDGSKLTYDRAAIREVKKND
ncbi:preprotein translocase subunit YajC [Bacillus taeanensis]|uniref:Preprotein translocase subunit YajC n=1 Tax=Bacillus taeanensis TaxID=273032 RepID=A0A366Y1Y8_9BACI|nr:preprotein translocase subunit YajC [Bacillus taeanensis]RBW70423.1 preprotein translocase subunit YajC [Bacillus taeanensis]